MRSDSGAAGDPRHACLLAVCVGLVLLGCGSTDQPRTIVVEHDLFDPSPSRRTAAIATVAQTGERRWVPRLVELLDDRDPAVRALANQTLEDLTGQKTGYAAYATPEERRPHVEAWQDHVSQAYPVDGLRSTVGAPPVDSAAGTPWSAPRVDVVDPHEGERR